MRKSFVVRPRSGRRFAQPRRCDIRRVGFFFDLPFDACVPDGSTFSLQDDEVLEGWPGVQVAPLPGMPTMPVDVLRPITSFHLKRVTLPAPIAEATRLAFPFILPGESESDDAPVCSRSAVEVMRLDRAPAPSSDLGDWLSDQFDAAHAKLNDFLVVLGMSSQDPHVRPVERAELPALIPYALTDPARNPQGTIGDEDRGLLILHTEVLYEAPQLERARLDHAVRVLAHHHAHGHPFFPYADAILAARNALTHGRTRQSALDAGTAVEVLINAVLREVGPLRGYREDKVARVVANVGLRNQLVEHIGPMLGVEVRLADPQTPFGRWFAGAYALRNRASHEGYRPQTGEVQAALDDVGALVSELADRLGAADDTRDLAGQLLVRLP